ncbi:MAG TPA: insulinase family protein [Bacilli bacterium]|nr:insulinase family protein [Bacilli bacterium]
MKYKKVEKKNYRLHLIKTKRFKSIRICFKIRIPLVKDDITKSSLLCDVLNYSSKKYPTALDVSNHSMDLYGSYINMGTIREGNSLVFSFSISFLNNKYTEETMLKESIDFISELIFNPSVDNNKFNEEALSVCKNYLKGAINSLKDDPASYAQYQMLNNMNNKKSYSFNMIGNLDDLDKISTNNLYEYYLQVIKTGVVDIYVIGDISFIEIQNLLKNKIKFLGDKNKAIEVFNYDDEENKEKEILEVSYNNQSKLSIGCKILNNNTSKIRYPLFLYNIILGASSDSKLFNNVREKGSYVYSINSHFESLDSIIIINCGLDYKNYEQVLKMIKKEMQDIKNGFITDEEIEEAKRTYVNANKLIYDSPSMIIDNYYAETLDYFDILDTRVEEVLKLTKEDISNFAKDVKIDTIFLLKEGTLNEENPN